MDHFRPEPGPTTITIHASINELPALGSAFPNHLTQTVVIFELKLDEPTQTIVGIELCVSGFIVNWHAPHRCFGIEIVSITKMT